MDEPLNDLTYADVVQMIESFNRDPHCEKLISKYGQKSIFEIAKTARTEKVHSAVLGWIFRENFEKIPINGLLSILYHNHTLQSQKKVTSSGSVSYNSDLFKKQRDIVEGLKTQAIVQNTKYTISNVWNEYPISSLSGKKDKKCNQYIDILIECKSPEDERLYIVIENKVNAAETKIEVPLDKKDAIIRLGGVDAIKTHSGKSCCGQTLAYFNFFHKEKADSRFIYVYLDASSSLDLQIAPELPKCACKGYIHITYQDLMDRVLIPLKLNKNIDKRSKYIINEYIDCLGATLTESEDDYSTKKNNENLKAMALDKETRDLIQEFWTEHEALIMAVLDSLSDDVNTKEETRKNIKSVVSALRSRNRDRYSFIYKGNIYDDSSRGYKKTGLLYEIVKVLSPDPATLLVEQCKEILDHNNKPGVISKADYDKLAKLSSSYANRFNPYPNSDPEIYISKDWDIDQIDRIKEWAATEGITIQTL